MIRSPKTLPVHASVEDARSALTDDHVHMLLLTEDGRLRGTLVRTDLTSRTRGTDLALSWSRLSGRTVPPDASAASVRDLLVRRGRRRLAVVDADHTLLGLVCLKGSRAGFCSGADVASRARTPHTNR